MKDPKILDATAVKMVKPLARQQARLIKRIRLGAIPAAIAPTRNETHRFPNPHSEERNERE